MKPKPPFYAVLLFLLMETYPALPQEIFFNKVLPPEGKIFAHVTGMVQDKQGYMWFATKKGLFRYDGYQMTVFKNNLSDTNSLLTDALEAICVDSAGIFWIATYGQGLERFDPVKGIFKHFRNDEKDKGSLSLNWVNAVLVDHQGTLWVGTGNGLDRFDPKTEKFIHYRNQPDDPTSISNNAVVAIYEDRRHELWVGTGSVYVGTDNEGGLNRMDKKTGKFIRYLHDPKKPNSLINNKVRSIFEDSKGNFWVGTSGDGLHTMNRTTGSFQRHLYNPVHPDKLSRPLFKKKPVLDFITFITEDITGAIWIGTSESGLNYYDPDTERIKHYESEKDTAGAFTDRHLWWAYTSREGVMWVSTIFGNLYRINPLRRKIPYDQSAGGEIRSFSEQTNGNLWIGTQNGLVVQARKDKTERRFVCGPEKSSSICSNDVLAVKQDQQDNIWVGTLEGLNFFDKRKETFSRYRHDPQNSQSLSSDFITTIYESKRAEIWIGTIKGLNRLNSNGSFTRYIFHPEDTTTFGLNIISSVLEDSQDTMWIGCWMIGDVHILDRSTGKYKTFLKGKGITSLYEDAEGVFWSGGEEGLFKFNRTSGDFVRYIDTSTLAEFSFVHSIVEDDQKNMWIGTQNGILKLNPQRIVSRIYGKSYGVNGYDLFDRSCYKAKDGKLYFGTNSGYYSFYPDQLPKEPPPPQIVFSGFHLAKKLKQTNKASSSQEPLSTLKTIQLKHDQNSFSFDFAAINYSSPEENRHLFILENYDEGWNQAGSERRATYFNVPPGKYVFRVKAATSNGIWTEKNIDIIITPPWWSTWWFRVAAALCVVALLYSVIRWRIHEKFRKQLEHSEKEKQLANLQRKTVELEMQALRAQMNPHFIFNCLSSINRFILKNESEPASDYLTKFSRLIRMVLTNSKKTFITLDDELEMLRLYLEMERLRFGYAFDYNISLKNEIEPDNIFIPPLLLQPFAENAIWHGLMHKQGQGHLEIGLSLNEKILTCIITDNGIGRSKAANIKSKSTEKQKSMGLQITTERLALLNQDSDVSTFFSIQDLTDDNNNPAGTQVILKIHYRDMVEAQVEV